MKLIYNGIMVRVSDAPACIAALKADSVVLIRTYLHSYYIAEYLREVIQQGNLDDEEAGAAKADLKALDEALPVLYTAVWEVTDTSTAKMVDALAKGTWDTQVRPVLEALWMLEPKTDLLAGMEEDIDDE